MKRPALALALLALPLACGGETKTEEPKKTDAAAPKGEPAKAPEDDAIAKRRAKREADEKAAKEAEAARLVAVEALAVLPEKLPKDIKKACDAVADAQLKFFEKMFEGAELEKLKAAQGTQRPMAIASCTKSGSIQAAACQANALNTATDKSLGKSISDIMRVCLEKFPPK